MKRSSTLGVGLVLCALGSPLSAWADPASDKVAAEALFDEGRRLVAAGDFAQACGKLEASQRLDPGVGTMLNLADCYERSGRTASAWAAFREAVSAAHNTNSLDREQIARDRARVLEPKLSYLTIVPWQGQQVEVKRDGVTVDPAMFNTPIPVDPGTHVVLASSAGKRQWSTTVEVAGDAARVSVAVPILPEDAATGSAPAQSSAPADAAPAPASNPGSTQRTVALVAGGVGVVGVVVGAVFGIKAKSTWDDAQAHCDAGGKNCGPEGAKLADDSKSQATLSTVGFIVGGVGLVGGTVLWLTAPSASDSRQVGLGIGPGSVTLHGRF